MDCCLTKRMARRIWLLMLGVLVGIGLAIKLILSRPRVTIAIPSVDVDAEWLQYRYGRENVVPVDGWKGVFIVAQGET